MKKYIFIKYPALFEINNDGISIEFPDIPGCLSCAFNKRQAIRMAKDALRLALHNVRIEELPPRKYPINRFTTKKIYLRSISVKMEIKQKYLIDKNAVDCTNIV